MTADSSHRYALRGRGTHWSQFPTRTCRGAKRPRSAPVNQDADANPAQSPNRPPRQSPRYGEALMAHADRKAP